MPDGNLAKATADSHPPSMSISAINRSRRIIAHGVRARETREKTLFQKSVKIHGARALRKAALHVRGLEPQR